MRLVIASFVAALVSLALPVCAQTSYAPPTYQLSNGLTISGAPTVVTGRDTATGLPCPIGLVSTCNASVNIASSVALTANIASVGATGAAVPASADYAGYSNGGTLTGLIGNSFGAYFEIQPSSQIDNDLKAAATIQPYSPVVTSALATSKVISAAATTAHNINVAADTTLSAAAWWIIVLDAASDPGNGAVTPKWCLPMGAGQQGYAGSFLNGMSMATGYTIVVSTTGCFTETQSAHAFISGF